MRKLKSFYKTIYPLFVSVLDDILWSFERSFKIHIWRHHFVSKVCFQGAFLICISIFFTCMANGISRTRYAAKAVFRRLIYSDLINDNIFVYYLWMFMNLFIFWYLYIGIRIIILYHSILYSKWQITHWNVMGVWTKLIRKRNMYRSCWRFSDWSGRSL